ncbi:MAG: glycerol kinase GlpK [Bacteriovoracaceae bacterium]|nr:glycerol kinase GlpK [Bacteriovoracaceae bacterium]
MGTFVLAIDQGTTGTTALLIDSQSLKIASEASKDYPQIYPKPGWVEHDLNEIWKTVAETVKEVLSKISASPKDIVSIGITNQRETTCAYTKDGTPLHHAIVWQDRRTSEFCAEHRDHFNKKFKPITGLPLDPYFSATKMKWLLENSSAVQAASRENNLCLSTIDTFVLFKLTQGLSFATEPSNASRTQLLSLDSFTWNDELLSFFKIPRTALPKVQDTFSHFGETKGLTFLPDGIPITCLFGDQQSALFGQACLNVGDLKCTYGTGAFLLVNTGETAIQSKQGLLTTAAYGYKGKKVYALEGSSYIAGAAVQWLRDSLKMIVKSSDVESLASQATDEQMEHLLFYPYFSGIGAPYWVPEAKAAILGMTRDTATEQIARACLEGITLAVNDCVKAFIKDLGHINDIKVDGGATANNLLMQSQSNFSKKNILRPQNIETTAYGAALGSMVGNGKIDIQEISKLWKLDIKFQPSSKEYADKKSAQWENTIQKVFL